MGSNGNFISRSSSTHKQQQPGEMSPGDTKLSIKSQTLLPGTSFGRVNNSFHKDFVYGYGDVPDNEIFNSKNQHSTVSEHGRNVRSSKKKKSFPATVGKVRPAATNCENDKSDKHQRLLDWLKASQAKRDENNRQVFSRWVEKMDNLKAQAREQGSCPAFYCDILPPPHVLYSAISNYQGESIGSATVYLGVPPFLYHSPQELVDPHLPQNATCFLKGSEQLLDVGTVPACSYYASENSGLTNGHELYNQDHKPRPMGQSESAPEVSEKKDAVAFTCTENSAVFGAPGTSVISAATSYPTPILFPLPCLNYINQGNEETNMVSSNTDGASSNGTSMLNLNPASSPVLFQTECRQVVEVPPPYTPSPLPKQSIGSNFYSPNACIYPMYDLRLIYNQGSSAFSFDVNHWNSLLDCPNCKTFEKSQEIEKQGVFQGTFQSELKNDTKFRVRNDGRNETNFVQRVSGDR